MKLYMVPLAPNPTKVMLYIAEREALGAQMNIEQIVVNTVKGRHKEPAHLARNPFGTVPTLELDDGTYLVESLAIIEYLEDRYPENALLSGSPEARGCARDTERIVDLRLAGPDGRLLSRSQFAVGVSEGRDKSRAHGGGHASAARLFGGKTWRRAPAAARYARVRRRLHAASVPAIHALHQSGCVWRPPAIARLGRALPRKTCCADGS